jgi:hypothetical protein
MQPFKIASLGRALRLTIAAYVWGIGPIAFVCWEWFFYSFSTQAFELIAFALLLLCGGLVLFLFERVIYSWLINFFISEPPHWLQIGGIRSGIRVYAEVFFFMLPIAIIYTVQSGTESDLQQIESELKILIQYLWLWLLITVIYCHFVRK